MDIISQNKNFILSNFQCYIFIIFFNIFIILIISVHKILQDFNILQTFV